MDWIKVKVRHIDYDFEGVEPEICWAWIRIMSMCAALERLPSNKQMSSRVGVEIFEKLKIHLISTGKSLPKILTKVMEDVSNISSRRKHDRAYMSEYRSKDTCKTLHNPLHTAMSDGKIREDKIREDKKDINIKTELSNVNHTNNVNVNSNNIDIGTRFDEFWTAYPKPIGQAIAIMTFRATVKTDKDFQDLMKALEYYKASDEFKKGFIKTGANWIEDWRGWLMMPPKKESALSKWEVKK